MLVYGRGEYEHFIESESFEIIYMPIDQSKLNENTIQENGIEEAY